jgi:TRAP transporter TAXI family solute receptor
MKALLPRLALLAAALAFCATPARAAEPDWPDQLRIGTASPGGTYYVYGGALAKILTRTLDLPVERLATEGPVQNIELMEAGEVKLGFVTIGVALQAWNGTGIWAGKKPARSMRVIFPMYDTPFQLLVLQDSGIRSVSEMSGKRVGVGPRGGTAATYFSEFFRVLKVPVSLAYGEWRSLPARFASASSTCSPALPACRFPRSSSSRQRTR